MAGREKERERERDGRGYGDFYSFLSTYFISYSTKLRPDGPVQRATKEGSWPNIKQKARYGDRRGRVIRGSPQNMC